MAGAAMSPPVFFQAHRGSVDEAPENTLSAFRHAWRFPGSIPETDIRTTADGALICLHDATLARTTNAPVAIRDVDVGELDLSEIRRWDAGIRLGSGWAGLQVPTLEEVLAMLSKSPDRQLYLEPKAVELAALKERVQRFRVDQQVLFVHASQEALVEIRTLFGNRPTMTWLSGDVEQIGSGFERLAVTDFQGISQLQVHLHVRAERPAIDYLFSAEQIQAMQARLARVGVDLQLRPFAMDAASLRRLLDLGVRWFVSDSPRRFSETLRAAKELPHV